MTDIEKNLKEIFGEISAGNNLGEKITLLGATKFVDASRINEAISAGLTTIGENHAQEFRDKIPFIFPAKNISSALFRKTSLNTSSGKPTL